MLQSASRGVMKTLAAMLVGFFEVLGHVPGHVKEGFVEAWRGLRSPDFPTRRMSVVFYLSLLGVSVTFYQVGQYVVRDLARQRFEILAAAELAAAERARAEELRRAMEPPPYQSIGTFTLELREEEGVTRTSGLRAAEMEIVLACSDIAACEWMASNIDRARGELGSLFTPTDRDKILSTGGKRAFREEIRDALNRLLEEREIKGTIIEVLFPRFIVT